jgi:hypothetical protein
VCIKCRLAHDELLKSQHAEQTDNAGHTVIAGTRRPDGTYRKEIRVRAGFVPQEEVPAYMPKGKAAAEQAKVCFVDSADKGQSGWSVVTCRVSSRPESPGWTRSCTSMHRPIKRLVRRRRMQSARKNAPRCTRPSPCHVRRRG